MSSQRKHIAIWALTPNGGQQALKLSQALGSCRVFASEKAGIAGAMGVSVFDGLGNELGKRFHEYRGHVFFMATGIVVRMIAPLIVHKTTDPSVVVVDEKGRYAVSLLSGHLGGANELACEVAKVLGGEPVITTATDVNGVFAIDMLAKERGLVIENPEAIKRVNMAFLMKDAVRLHDPYGYLTDTKVFEDEGGVMVWVDDRVGDVPDGSLVLRPKTLAAGIGCNRGTPMAEIRDLLTDTLNEAGLSPLSLGSIASVDIKHDEHGLLELSEALTINLELFTRDQLDSVETIETPSKMVEKHIGVKSVCEAAAILSAKTGQLIVPKRKTKNVTVALARIDFSSSASDPEAGST